MPIRYLSGLSVDSTVLVVDAANDRVGIGTASPAYKLDVNGSLNVAANLYNSIGGNKAFGGNGSTFLYLYTGTTALAILNNADTSELVRITNGGNLLIGTTTDSGYKLDVSGTGRFTDTLRAARAIINDGANSTDGIKIVGSLTTSAFTSGIEFIRTTVSGGSKIEPLRDIAIGGVGLNFLVTANNTAEINATYSSAAVILNNGNVGIGTTSPGAKLEVDSGSTLPIIRARYNATYYADYDSNGIQFVGAGQNFNITDNGSSVLYLKSGGNVGIGTTSPTTAKLVISQTGGTQLHLISGDSSGSTDVLIRLTSSIDYRGRGILMDNSGASGSWYAGVPYTGGSYSIGYGTTQPEYLANSKFFINTSGNVGIGTTSPSQKLTVIGTFAAYSAIGSSDNVRTGIAHYDTTAQAEGVGGQLVLGYKYIADTDYTEGAIIKMYKENGTSGEYGSGLKFQVRNTGANLSTKVTINPSGNVGIGTTAPDSLLHISGSGNTFTRYTNTTSAGHYIDIGANSAGQSFVYGYGAYPLLFATNGSEAMRITSAGEVLIGTTTDSGEYKLQVNGRGLFQERLVVNDTPNDAQVQLLGNGTNIISIQGRTAAGSGSSLIAINNDGGNTSIGTTASLSRLTVLSDSSAQTLSLIGRAADSIATIRWWNNAGNTIYTAIESNASYTIYNTVTNGYAAFQTNNSERMRITSDGNVGIGTTNPDVFSRGYSGKILGISSSGQSAIQLNAATGNAAYFDMGVNGTRYLGFYTDTTSSDISTIGAYPLTLSINSVPRLTIASTGAATFSSSVTATQGFFTATANTYAGGALRLTAHTGGTQIFLTSVGTDFALSNGGSADHLLIASTGAATFSNALQVGGQQAAANYGGTGLNFDFTSGNIGRIASVKTTSGGSQLQFFVYNTSGADINALTIASTGAATFSSSVTASSLIKSGGTASQYLMADGSTSTIASANVYTQTFFVPNTGGTSQWIKLGTWTAAQGGNVVTVQIDQHEGYNASTNQNQQVYIYMKTSNGSSVDANGFAADSSFWTEGLSSSIQPGDVIWESNAAGVSATTYTLYVLMGQYTNGSQYTVTTRGGTWANVETLTSPSGTTGSSTILLSENRFVVNNVLTVGGSSSGNVLIGTTADVGYKLDVFGKTRVYTGAASGATSPDADTALLIDSAGNQYIELRTSSASSGLMQGILFTDNGQNAFIGFKEYSGGTAGTYGEALHLAYYDYSASDPNNGIYFGTSNTPSDGVSNVQMFIKGSGNVGIGTTAPVSIGTGITTLDIQGSNAGGVAFGPSGTKNYIYGASTMYVEAHTTAVFTTSGSERMRITSAGDVGIGTTSPISKLTVLAASTGYSSDSQIKISDGSTSYYGGLSFDDSGATRLSIRNSYDGTGSVIGFGFGSSADKVQIIDGTGLIVNEGNVGIGTTSPNKQLTLKAPASNYAQFALAGGDTSAFWNLYAFNDNSSFNIAYNGTTSILSVTSAGAATFSSSVTASSLIKSGGTSAQYLMADGSVSTLTNPVTGSGTTNYVPKWTSGSAIGDSAIYDNGNVGIGTTSPGFKLTLAAASATDSDILLAGMTGVSNGFTIRRVSSSFVYSMIDGNVGIGTTAPVTNLHVSTTTSNDSVGNIQYENANTGTGAATNAQLIGKSKYGTLQYMVWESNGGRIGMRSTANSGSGNLYFTVGTDSVSTTMLANGNVGIGTTSPSSLLNVVASGSAPAALTVQDNARKVKIGRDQIEVTDLSDTAVTMYLQPNANLVINSSAGNVGIGVQPTEKLHVDGSTLITYNNSFQSTNSVGNKAILARVSPTSGIVNYAEYATATNLNGFVIGSDDARVKGNIATDSLEFITNTSTRMTVLSGGNVGINTTTPGSTLHVIGDVLIQTGALGVGVNPNATDGRIDASNDIVAFSTSDKRLKENITPIANALEKVRSLTGVEFDWKEETKSVHGYEGHDVGVIAQDVQAVLPEAVRTNDSGYLSVRYEKMIALLVEAMKEQQAQIDELKAQINDSSR